MIPDRSTTHFKTRRFFTGCSLEKPSSKLRWRSRSAGSVWRTDAHRKPLSAAGTHLSILLLPQGDELRKWLVSQLLKLKSVFGPLLEEAAATGAMQVSEAEGHVNVSE